MELLELTANVRKSTGKGTSRALRREGLVPAVLYGPNTDPLILSVNAREMEKLLKDSGTAKAPMNLTIKNGETAQKTAMIKEIQMHPVSRSFIHVDFYEISMDRKIQVQVPVEIRGQAPGVEDGGALQIVRREIDVLCLPLDIPESILIDVSSLKIGDSVHVEDISIPEGVEIQADTNYTVVTVSSPMAESAPTEGGDGEEGAGAEKGEE